MRHQSAIARSRAAGVEPLARPLEKAPVRGGRRDIGGDILAQETRIRPAAHPTCRLCGCRALSEMSGKETSCGGWRGFYDCDGASQR